MRRQTADYSLVSALFDFSFTEFVTTKMVRSLYALALAGTGLIALAFGLSGFGQSVAAGFGRMILAALGFLVASVIGRVWLEMVVVFFRIADHTAEIAEQGAVIAMNTTTISRLTPEGLSVTAGR